MPQVCLDQLVAQVLHGQALVSFPTDTVPALAAHPDQAEQIFVAKQRSPEKPLILMAASAADIWDYVTGSAAERQIWQAIAQRYWPGALTLVLPASDRVSPAMNPTDPSSIGVRVPNHAVAQAILQGTGPLATTSANRSGEPALQTIAEIEAAFPQVLTLLPETLSTLSANQILAQEPAKAILGGSGVPSTVLRWVKGDWEILRQGAVDVS